MNIGIIGTGTIAAYLIEQVNGNHVLNGTVKSVFGRNEKTGNQLQKKYNTDFYTDFNEFMKKSYDIVIEAASADAATLYLKDVAAKGIDMVVSSIGAFKDLDFLEEVKLLAHYAGSTVYLPSGAIGGLDLLQSANAVGGLEHVQLTTKKSPHSLGIEIEEAGLLFEGSAYEAVERFPRNLNVALVLALAGIGMEKTKVRIIADPEIEWNSHTIEASGNFGKMKLQIENHPMLDNPKTSQLAALSIVSLLKNRNQAVMIGN